MSLYEKTKAKEILVDTQEINKIVEETIGDVAKLVGSTLGPAGRVVLIERDNLSPFVTKDGVTVAKNIGYTDSSKNVIVEAAKEICLNTGKEAGDGPQDLDSLILTPNGWIRMGDITVGMEICGTSGTKQTVLGVFPKGKKEKYEVYFSGGALVTCCEDHLWTTTTTYGKSKTIPLKEILKDYKKLNKNGYPKYKYYVTNTYVDFNEKDLKIDPYFLGVMLGDGSLSNIGGSSIEISLGKNKEHILSKIVLPKGVEMRSEWNESKNYFRVKFTGVNSEGKSILKSLLKEIGLLGTTSKDKFIPKNYLYSSIISRKKLFQGLIDTDGHINKRGMFEFSTVSQNLFNDFSDLCRGLGKQISIRTKNRKKSKGYSTTTSFVVQERKGYRFGNKIIDIKKTGEFVEMQCIKVSNPDNLYITNGYTVTHNTTSAIVLADRIIQNGNKYLEATKGEENPQTIARDLLEIYENKIVDVIKKYSRKIETEEEMKHVATISSNGDTKVAEVVVEAVMSAGEDGHVVILEDLGGKTRCEYIDGYIITSSLKNLGALGTYFINDKSGQQCKMDNGFVMLYNGEINDHGLLLQLEELLTKNPVLAKSPFLILAHNFSDSAMEKLAKWFKAGYSVLPIKTPQYATTTSRTMFLSDMAAFTNGSVINPGDTEINVDSLGSFREVRANLYECMVYPDLQEDEERESRIKDRVMELNAIHDSAPSEFDRAIIKAAISRISGGVATIFVGGITELEIRERKARVEDAVEAVRSAIEEGIVYGGATMYLAIKKHLEFDPELKKSWIIIIDSLDCLIKKLLSNAGISKEEDLIIKTIKDSINIEEYKIDNLYDVNIRSIIKTDGCEIIEPAKVIRVVLANALSVATMLMTLGGVVVIPRDLSTERQLDLQKDVFKSIMNGGIES